MAPASFVCVCGRSFYSRKVLDGHMRMHGANYRLQGKLKIVKPRQPSENTITLEVYVPGSKAAAPAGPFPCKQYPNAIQALCGQFEGLEVDEPQHAPSRPLRATHQCRICGMVFTRRHMLGGHMRAHYEKPLKRKLPSPSPRGQQETIIVLQNPLPDNSSRAPAESSSLRTTDDPQQYSSRAGNSSHALQSVLDCLDELFGGGIVV